MNNVLFEKKGNIGFLTIDNQPALNALSYDLMLELYAKLDEIENDNDLYCLVLTGAGDKAFVAGADIAYMSNMNGIKAYKWGALGNAIFMKLERLPAPVIGAINGFALGGGMELALACDILIASEKAVFAQPEVGLGIIPGFGGTQRLPRKVGINKAKELIFTGAKLRADEALRIGLVNKVVAHDTLMAEATAMAESICKNAPIAVRCAKTAINEGIQGTLAEGVAVEQGLFATCFSTCDQKSAMKAFMEKNRDIKFENK